MQGNKPFESVIEKIWNDIDRLESRVNLLWDVNLLTLPIVVLKSLLNPTDIKELQDELANIRSKTQSTLEQYARVANETRLEANPSSDDTRTQTTYLSQIMEIMEYISSMEERLKQKDIQQVLSAATVPTVKTQQNTRTPRQARSRDQAESDWDDLKL